MKILTKEEEAAHYNATVKGGVLGGTAGLGVGIAAVYLSSRRFPTIASLTLPMKTFLVTSSATFVSIVAADRASRRFEDARDPARQYRDRARQQLEAARAKDGISQRALSYLRENRFSFILGGWAMSMAASWVAINRNKYLTKSQKLVQARVVAQGVTIALVVLSTALEIGDARKGDGRWESVMVLDPEDPEHKKLVEKKIHKEAYEGEDMWRDMVETEERRLKERRKKVDEIEQEDRANGKVGQKNERKSDHGHGERAEDGKSKDTNKGQSRMGSRSEGPGPATK